MPAVMPVVVVRVAVVVVVAMGVVMIVVPILVVVVAGAVMATEALAQGELGGQLPDGLPLVQDGLLLPHKALAQVQDGGFGLVGHHGSPAAAIVAVAAGSMGHTGWGVAAGVCFRGNRSANKLGADAVVIFDAVHTACRCRA